MIKIKYPKNAFNFICDYLEIFDLIELEQNWQDYKIKYNLQNANFSIVNILYGDFEFLLNKSLRIQYDTSDYNQSKNAKLYDLKTIFNYNKYQSQIADFFVNYKDEMKLSTCFYCNIDYVNAFSAYSYKDEVAFINGANQKALEKIKNVGEKTYEKIFKKRPYGSINEFRSKLKGERISNLDEIINEIKNNSYPVYIHKNHFTLDHVIDKATNPIVALSLFNFVPSCYSCNSKFKKSEQFTRTIHESYKSPTSNNFNFNEAVTLKALYVNGLNSQNIKSIDDFEINFDDNRSAFNDYTKIFRLEERYRFHKNIALELLNKRQDYSDSQIEEIAKILFKTEDEIKKDIFGKEVFDGELHEKPFTKLKRDIYV